MVKFYYIEDIATQLPYSLKLNRTVPDIKYLLLNDFSPDIDHIKSEISRRLRTSLNWDNLLISNIFNFAVVEITLGNAQQLEGNKISFESTKKYLYLSSTGKRICYTEKKPVRPTSSFLSVYKNEIVVRYIDPERDLEYVQSFKCKKIDKTTTVEYYCSGNRNIERHYLIFDRKGTSWKKIAFRTYSKAKTSESITSEGPKKVDLFG